MKSKIVEVPIKERKVITTDRFKEKPCCDCRKRDSCLLHPHNQICRSFEEGIPWSFQYNDMITDQLQD